MACYFMQLRCVSSAMKQHHHTKPPRKKDQEKTLLEQCTPESPVYTGVSGPSSGPAPGTKPGTVCMPLRRRVRRLTGVSGPDRSLRTQHRSLRPARRQACQGLLGLAHVTPSFAPTSSFIPKLPLFKWLAYIKPHPSIVNPRLG